MEENKVTPPPMPQMPAVDRNNRPMYTLLDGEKIIFELRIDQATKSGFDISSLVSVGWWKNRLAEVSGMVPFLGIITKYILADLREGVFVITNMRCIVAQITMTGCTHREKQRTVWAFPGSALNQSVGYEKNYYKDLCAFKNDVCCCRKVGFSIDVGLTIGCQSENVKIYLNESNVSSDEQALALVAKIAELGEHAQK